MRLEHAHEFADRTMTRRMAKQMRARLAGATCHKCASPATTAINGEDLCNLDAQVTRNRLRRESMRGRS